MFRFRSILGLAALLLLAGGLHSQEKAAWTELFNGKDLAG